MPAYLVERYWPGVTSEVLSEARQRLRQVMKQMISEGTRLQEVSCTLVPSEEVVFSVYQGPSAHAVFLLCKRAGVPASRIVEAIAMDGGVPGSVPRGQGAADDD